MSSTLRDELASLRIERGPRSYAKGVPRGGGGGGEWGMRLLSGVLWMVPLGLLGGAGYVGYSQYEQFKPKVEVKVGIVERVSEAEAIKLFDAKGYVRARFRAAVGTKVPGRIQELFVEEGSRVERGELIAILEHNEIDAMLETREASKVRADAELVEARSDLANKERKATRQTRLYTQHQASTEEADLAVTERDKARARVLALEAQIKMIDAQIHEMRETERNLEIRAPFSGTILTKTAEKGETINTMSLGAGGGRSALVEIADLKTLEVETEIAEKEVSKVRVDQLALVEVPAAPGKAFKAHVRQLIQMGDRAKGTVKVYVAIDDPESGLFPELYASKVSFLPISLTSDELDQLAEYHLFVPREAVRAEGDKTFVWVLDPSSKVRRQEVKVEEHYRKLMVVEGLQANERVVLNPSDGLSDGQVVRNASASE
jgi:RND family efflux transporter MFP subunit